MRAILLNGPRRVGKDTICRMLYNELIPLAAPAKFAKPIVEFMTRHFGVTLEADDKDMPSERLFGRTPREVAIAYSEKFCKPLFGQDYFGRVAVQTVEQIAQQRFSIAIFSDSRFAHEADAVVRHLGKGRVLQIRLSRPGATFSGDSGSWWHHDDIGSLEFDNDCETLAKLQQKVRADLVPELWSWISA